MDNIRKLFRCANGDRIRSAISVGKGRDSESIDLEP